MKENFNNYRGKELYDNLSATGAGIYGAEPEEIAYFPIWKWILERTPEHSKILDIGCGTGRFVKLCCVEKNCFVLGVDFSEVVIRKAREYLPRLNYLTSKFLCLDVEDSNSDLFSVGQYKVLNNYDIVVFSEILEHVKDDLRLLQQIPAGKEVFLTVPNFEAEGHVRWFSSVEDVKERYEKYVRICDFYVFNRWFALHGVRI